MALGTRTKFQLEIPTINVISSIVYFREIILESSRNVSETTPRPPMYRLSKLCITDPLCCRSTRDVIKNMLNSTIIKIYVSAHSHLQLQCDARKTIFNNYIMKWHSAIFYVQLIEAEWRIYASINQAIIDSDTGFSAKPLSEPMLDYCQLDHWKQISVIFGSKYNTWHWRKCIWKCRLKSAGQLFAASMY